MRTSEPRARDGFGGPPPKQKCVHVVVIDDWFPELCAITLPLIRRWAERIGADFNLISKSKFPGWPPNYERIQIWEAGREYFWNINVDADYVIHPELLEDPTEGRDPRVVAAEGGMAADHYFRWNRHFEKDGRNQGVGDSFIVSSWLTHEIWEPLQMTCEEASAQCLRASRQVSEYCVTVNLARYGFRFNGAIRDKRYIHHISSTATGAASVEVAKAKVREMGMGMSVAAPNGASPTS